MHTTSLTSSSVETSTTLSPKISQVLADSRWAGNYGIGRFASEILKALPTLQRFSPGIAPYPFHRFDILQIIFQIVTRRPKLYFSLGFNPPVWCPVPFVFSLYDLILLRFPQEANRLMQPYFRYIVRPAARRAKLVLTSSEFSRQEIIAWAKVPAEKVIAVGCGVDASFCPEGDRHDPGFPYLFYVGNHRPHKNIPRLLEAFAQALPALPPELKLMLSGKDKTGLAPFIAELGLSDRVVFAGFINDEMLPTYYRGATALVFPSLYEGFGLPPLEAMACGVPVMTSNVTSLPEVVGDGALLVDPYSVQEMAEGIKKITLDQDYREDIVQRGLARSTIHTWEKTVARTQAILLQCLQD
jgi:glycosyltransferase involved in cell wall biosynthesis